MLDLFSPLSAPGVGHLDEPARHVSDDPDDRMQHPLDDDAAGLDLGGHGVDQEGRIVNDQLDNRPTGLVAVRLAVGGEDPDGTDPVRTDLDELIDMLDLVVAFVRSQSGPTLVRETADI